ncbi:hypothetical protein BJY52DRAFT_699722 [Lactarius psammicola]|nr:hypothetical protein BJY52DRAFT_699722 [Lactarius psammicola]
MVDLPPLAIGEDDEGTPEYLAITDQWSVSTMSSPPTSSVDDGLRERDEIFAPSSDSREPIGDLLAAKMDMVYMPRKSRVGGFQGVLNAPATSASVSSPIDSIVTSLTSANYVCTTLTPDDIRQHSGNTEDNPFLLLSSDFPKEVIDPDIFDWPEETGLMDVPLLPAPNVHTRNVTWPSDLGSLLTHENFSFFCVVKGIKSLNLELTWRPYSSEQATPTLEELVGVTDLYKLFGNACSDAEEDKNMLTDLLNMAHPLTRPISIEDENERGIEVITSATAKSDISTICLASVDSSDSNVLLTRAERCQSRSLRRPHLERDRGYTGRWDVSRCNTRSHISEKVIVGGPEGRYQLCPAELSGHGSVYAMSPSSLRFSGW